MSDTARTLAEVAVAPKKDDCVILPTGHIRYRVVDATEMTIRVRREAVRTGPFLGEREFDIGRPTWWDIVTYGACALE